jgi:hypothetical protein
MDPSDIHEVSCIRCGHIWMARAKNPKRCSRCHNLLWNTPRRVKIHKKRLEYNPRNINNNKGLEEPQEI